MKNYFPSRQRLNPFFMDNLPSSGSKAKLTDGNPLAYNEDKAKIISLTKSQTKGNLQGTLNGQLKYWKGQKLLPDDPNQENCCTKTQKQGLLKEAGYVLAQIEQIKFSQVGRRTKVRNTKTRLLHDYFASSSTRWAWCSYLFQRYYEDRCFTKMEVTSHLDISSKKTLQLVKYAVEHGMVEWTRGKCYRATDLFNYIYIEYIALQTATLMPLWAKMSLFMATADHLNKSKINGN